MTLEKLLRLHAEAKRKSQGGTLGAAGSPYDSMEEFVLRRGTPQRFSALDAAEAAYVKRCTASWTPKPQQCFANAQRAVFLGDPERRFEYAEGFVLAQDVGHPILHGWVLLGTKVVELTLPEPGIEYRGVTFDREEIQRRFESGVWGSFIDDWGNGWPLLRRSGG